MLRRLRAGGGGAGQNDQNGEPSGLTANHVTLPECTRAEAVTITGSDESGDERRRPLSYGDFAGAILTVAIPIANVFAGFASSSFAQSAGCSKPV